MTGQYQSGTDQNYCNPSLTNRASVYKIAQKKNQSLTVKYKHLN